MSAVADGVGCARLRRAGEGAGAGERAERGGAKRGEEGRRGARAAERAQGRETASPMVLHCVVGE